MWKQTIYLGVSQMFDPTFAGCVPWTKTAMEWNCISRWLVSVLNTVLLDRKLHDSSWCFKQTQQTETSCFCAQELLMFANFWPHSMAGFSSTTTHYPTSRLPLPDRATALRGMFGVPRDLDQAKYYLERGAEAVGEFLWCQNYDDMVHLWWIISKSWTENDEFWWSWFTPDHDS